MKTSDPSYIKSLLKNDAGFILLRSTSSHLIISFLYETFRETHRTVIPSDEIESKFAAFLASHPDEESNLAETLEDEFEESDFQKIQKEFDLQTRARKYISSWCSDEKKYLHKYYNQSRVPVVELSPSIERLFNFIENSEQKEFVGTDSRFQTILFQLRDLNQHVNSDPETRIKELKNQRKKIDDEIQQIQKTGEVRTYSKVEIEERLDEIRRSSRDLLSEFRQVEENFRVILQGIYKKQSEDSSSRGTILGYTLDTDRKMWASPQGQSFSSFWNFISQDRDNEITTLTRDISKNSADDISAQDDFLPFLKRYLYDAGHKIIEQNRALTDRLNRILQQQTSGERQQISKLTAEIKKLMHVYAQKVQEEKISPPQDFMKIGTKPAIYFPQSRKPVLPSREVSFSKIETHENVFNPADFSELFNQFYVDEKILLDHIAKFKKQNGGNQFTLEELSQSFPIQKGLSEIVAYFALAGKRSSITIDTDKTDEITYEKDGGKVKVKIPRLIFA